MERKLYSTLLLFLSIQADIHSRFIVWIEKQIYHFLCVFFFKSPAKTFASLFCCQNWFYAKIHLKKQGRRSNHVVFRAKSRCLHEIMAGRHNPTTSINGRYGEIKLEDSWKSNELDRRAIHGNLRRFQDPPSLSWIQSRPPGYSIGPPWVYCCRADRRMAEIAAGHRRPIRWCRVD